MEAGRHGRVNRELVAALGVAGMFERVFTSSSLTATDLCQIRQGMARVCTEAETAFAVQGLGGTPIQLAVKATVDSNWTEWRRPDTVAALLSRGATIDGLPDVTGYDQVDALLKAHRTGR